VSGGFTLHPVATAAEARRLGQAMDNCLGSYADRLTGIHRIVEVRRDGRTVYAVHVERGRVVTFEAKGNRPPRTEDVPVVRGLLAREGYLAATVPVSTLEEPPAAVEDDGPPGVMPRPGQLELGPRSEVRTAGVRQHRTARRRHPAPPPGISVQELATEHLGAPTLQGPDWSEVAAALWGVGLLSRLPGPEQTAFVRIVRDLAARVAVGGDAGLPRRDPPSAEQRRAARAALLERATPAEPHAWQLRRMAAVLEVPLRP
jgi:hypothetical protein